MTSVSINGWPNGPGRPPRIQDIAAAAGVSVATVSLVLNDRDAAARIATTTREKILTVAREFGYAPNIAARRLAHAETGLLVLGVLAPLDGRLPLIGRVIRGVHLGLGADGGGVELLVEVYPGGRLRESPLLRSKNRANGLLVTSTLPEDDEYLESLARTPVPLVVLQRSSRHNYVNADNRRAGREVVAHLHGLGHRRIGVIAPDIRSAAVAARLDGYADGLAELGLPLDRRWQAVGEFSSAGGYRAACQLLDVRPAPTAVYLLSDGLAIGAIRAIRESGRRVPEDVAVVGHDDLEFAAYADPPLTTVHVPIERMASRAAQMLIDLVLQRTRAPLQELFDAHLVVRRSCGAQGGERRTS